MSKVGSMTFGLALIFLGIQLFLVKSYLLTPTATRFVNDYFNSNNGSQFATTGPTTLGNGRLLNGGQSNGALSNAGFNGARQNTGNNPLQFGSSNQGQLGRHPGQSWPYYSTNSGNNGAAFSGRPFQNSSFANSSVGMQGASPASSSASQVFPDGQIRKRFVPPRWIMWPALFLGSVFFLHGVALRS